MKTKFNILDANHVAGFSPTGYAWLNMSCVGGRGEDNLLDHITIIYATIKAIGSEYIIAENDQHPLYLPLFSDTSLNIFLTHQENQIGD